MEDDDRRVVGDLQTTLQRPIDQVGVFTSEELLTDYPPPRIELSNPFEELTTEGHVRAPHLRLCFQWKREQTARFEVHDRYAVQ